MWRIFLMVSLLCWSADGQRVTCRDETDEPVDWYIIYKAPRLNNIGTTGLEYLYIDSAGKKEETLDPQKLINHPEGVLANTLRPIFTTSMTDNFGFITYSDQPPGCNAFAEYGHSKGVVMMDKTTGVWLLHSLPQFPFKRDPEKFWPRSGAANAQTFICVTFNYDQFQHIGQHLLDIAAFPFDHHIPTGFHDQLKQATEKDLEERPRRDANQIKTQLLTSAGVTSEGLTGTRRQFRSFAKRKIDIRTAGGERILDDNIFDGDLYLAIAERYQTHVRVQTWHSENEACRSGKYEVIRIASLKAYLKNINLGKRLVNWEAGNDHSKWCVGKDNNNDLICIADVNRAVTQYKRPGGGLCFRHKEASDLFKDVIAGTEECPRLTPNCPYKRRRINRDTDSYSDCVSDPGDSVSVSDPGDSVSVPEPGDSVSDPGDSVSVPEPGDSVSDPGDSVSVPEPGDSVSDPGDSVYDSDSDSESGGYRDVIVHLPQAPWYYIKRVKGKRS
ncbi:deoxyribonuclease-2-beta-like [Perca fluviatilis]|uniref:deoxyribonuclease-2-beta-like n=1 Tax=Perca fluviatilis TaxID=8168 RepID=UPI00196683CF|nr:deoxyribonuclease-2-beta-like [Perca fluviatilis]